MKFVKLSNKFIFAIIIFIVSFAAVLFAIYSATAEEPTTTYNATGTIYENGTTSPLQDVTVDAFYGPYDIERPNPFWSGTTSSDGKFTVENIPEGKTISLQFYFAASHPLSSVYAGNRIYVDTPFTSDVDLDSLKKKPDLSLHKYTKNVTGTVIDEETGKGIPDILIEFYNPYGLVAPFADCSATTDADGHYNLSSSASSGIPVNIPVYLVASYNGQKPGTGDSYDNYTSETINDVIFSLEGPNTVDFLLAKQTTIQLLDREQGEETFFEQWKHKLYINGEYIDEGILGDSKLTVKGDFKFKIVQDCTMELKYSLGSDEYTETFEPVRYKSVAGWIPVYPLNNVKAQNWKLWEGSYQTPQINCYQNFEYQWKQKTGYLYMDVNYVEAAPLELSFDDALHSYFHIIQTVGDETYTYDTVEPFQHNFFDGTKIIVDNENTLIIDSEVGQSNAIQHTEIQVVPVEGVKLLHWKLNGEIITRNSSPYFAHANQAVNLRGCFHPDPDPVPDVVAQTGDENGMLILILAAILGLAVIGLISYFVIKKVQVKKTKNRKH